MTDEVEELTLSLIRVIPLPGTQTFNIGDNLLPSYQAKKVQFGGMFIDRFLGFAEPKVPAGLLNVAVASAPTSSQAILLKSLGTWRSICFIADIWPLMNEQLNGEHGPLSINAPNIFFAQGDDLTCRAMSLCWFARETPHWEIRAENAIAVPKGARILFRG